jgi:hypothetical protein
VTKVDALVVDPQHPQTVYAGTDSRGVLETRNGGGSWKAINNGLPGLIVHAAGIKSLAIASSGKALYAGTGDGGSGATGGTGIFRIRIGTTTLTGNIVTTVSPANVANQTNQGFTFEANITVRTIGAGGTIIGHSADQGRVMFNLAEIQSVDVAAVAVDTTASKILELTYISGNAGTTLTFKVAYILWL